MRRRRLLWFIAAVFIIACFWSGAWLGKTLSQLPPIVTSGTPGIERADRVILRQKERETAIATAIASPVAVLIVFLTVLVVSGMLTKNAERAS